MRSLAFTAVRGARRHRIFLLVGLLAIARLAAETQRAHLTLLSTTDLHGHIYPIDYGTNRPSNNGLAKVATLIRQIRGEAPDLILLDCGDLIQGTPMAYYHNRMNNGPIDPMILAMNTLRYDAMAIGNHEYNFGLGVLQKARREAKFPWLSANTLESTTGQPAFAPYLIREVQGVRLGILGLTTPGVPSWENEANYRGLQFEDPIASSRRWVEHLRRQEKVDVVVLAMHMGLEVNLHTGRPPPGQVPNENTALAIARQVPDIDLMFLGHTHRDVPSLTVAGVLLTQAGFWGNRLSRADLYLERESPAAPWKLTAKAAVSLPIGSDTAPDPELLELARPYHEQTQAWLSRVVGRCAQPLSSAQSRLRDTAIIDLIQRAQLEAGKADVSFAAAFTLDATLPAGAVSVREISGLYVYENTLVVLELTGAQIKAALEQAARYFLPYRPGASAAELIDPAVPGYNFDMAEGVDYTIDLTRAPGDRITGLTFRGEPLDPGCKLRVATNNYRINGGGGYSMFKEAPVLHRSSEEIRNLIISWVERHPEIPTAPTGNWRIKDH